MNRNLITRRKFCELSLISPIGRILFADRHDSGLVIGSSEVTLGFNEVSYRFTKQNRKWAFHSVRVAGTDVAIPLSRMDSFWIDSGEASTFDVLANSPECMEIEFGGFHDLPPEARIRFSIFPLARQQFIQVELFGIEAPVCAYRTASSSENQRGAWVTRGETASDAEGREVFIDGSGKLVFGHSFAGDVDTAYVFQASIRKSIDKRGKSAQASSTMFKSGRREDDNGGYYGFWQIQPGIDQPKKFNIWFDRDLGGRLHRVCEKYYAEVVDTQVDFNSLHDDYDPLRAMELMPLRLSCPESLIPGYGWHMEEYRQATYPFGHSCGIQTGALLGFEGLATGRDWERNFGKYVIDQMPLWGKVDGTGYFAKRSGGWAAWSGTADHEQKFPFAQGGSWADAEHLYWIAIQFQDDALREHALGLMKHDLHIKLDLDAMYFPPRWSALPDQPKDNSDDWATTACLGYCAEISSQILYRETGNVQYLQIADRITDWFRAAWGPETRMNYLHPEINTFHCWVGWIPNAMIHRYERSGDPVFLDIAKDLAWIMMMTSCVTEDHDSAGRPLTGVTCVGVRGCVDYDCTPNLCQEKDLVFVTMMGTLLDHASGASYAKYLNLQKLVLPRDRWSSAFDIQEQSGLNLRTNYDNYPRAITNLAFALNRGSDPQVAIFETLVSKRDLDIRRCRDSVIANGTGIDRTTRVQLRYLQPGRYRVHLDQVDLGLMTAESLDEGLSIACPANSMRRLRVKAEILVPVSNKTRRYDLSITYLSDLREHASQRGVGFPTPVFVKDLSFDGMPIEIARKAYEKGLGLKANTVVVYKLDSEFDRFCAIVGMSEDEHTEGSPKAACNLTIFVDGHCGFSSGPVSVATGPQFIDVDVRNADMLVLRCSSNWENNGDLRDDKLNLADARLIGREQK